MTFVIKYFLLFIIYSVMGWVYETLFCSITEKRFVNRGFLNGPYCPIYGVGSLIIIFSLNWTSNIFLIFICSVILTGILEYATSFFMELFFHARWWDYSTRKFNINGRVCLEGGILFGIFSTLLLEVINPFFESVMVLIPDVVNYYVSFAILIVFVIDNIVTFAAVICLDEKLKELKDIIGEKTEYVFKFAEEHKIEANRKVQAVIEKTKNIELVKNIKKLNEQLPDLRKIVTEKLSKQHVRIIKAFPKLKSQNYNEVLSNIKKIIH